MVKFVNNVKTAVLLAGLMALCMAVGHIWGPNGVLIGFAIGLLSNGVAYFYSDKIALLAISRSREYAADAEGAELAGSPHGLASALAKLESYNQRIPMRVSPAHSSLFIVQPLLGGGMASLFSTHPPTEKRIAKLLGRE